METTLSSPDFENLEAERRILAVMLVNPRSCIGDCVEQISPEHFSQILHQKLFVTMVEIWNANTAINLLAVERQILKEEGFDEGEARYLLEKLACMDVDQDRFLHDLQVLREKYFLREIAKITRQIGKLGLRPETASIRIELIDALQRLVPELAGHLHPDPNSIKDHVLDAIEFLEQLYCGESVEKFPKEERFPTGITSLDAIINGGLGKGELMVIAGAPRSGKTALAVSIAMRNSVENELTTAYYSLGLSAVALTQRFISAGANRDFLHRLNGALEESDFPLICDTASKIAESCIFINDTPGLTPIELWGLVQRQRLKHGIQAVFVDPINSLSGGHKSGCDEILVRLKEMAVGLHVPVIVLCNLPEEDARNGSKEIDFEAPPLSILQRYCDVTAFLSRPYPSKSGVDRINLYVRLRRQEFVGQASLNIDSRTGRISHLNLPLVG